MKNSGTLHRSVSESPQQWVENTVRNLQSVSVQKGDRVAIISENAMPYATLLLALWQLGAVAVPINVRQPAMRVIEALKEIRCHKLIVSARSAGKARYRDFDVFELEQIVPDSTGNDRIFLQWPARPSFLDREQEATIVFTSGSTGKPKAVLHTFRNHYFSARGSNDNIPFATGDRWLLSLPLYHVGGLAILFRAMANGGTVVIPPVGKSIGESLAEYRITHISLVATQLHRLMAEPRALQQLQGLKAMLVGGSKIPVLLIRKAVSAGLPIHTTYGCTEMASQITTTPPASGLKQLLTSGKLLKYRRIKIAPDNEILVKGETLFRGYIEGEDIVAARDDDGWFHTGDVGYIDKQGYLVVTGRKDNMFTSGGENIQPEEIEKYLCAIDGIAQAIVVPVHDHEFGNRPVAFLQFDDQAIPLADIRKLLAGKIARYKIPDFFFPFPDAVPQQGMKLNRKYFQQLAKNLIHKEVIE